MPDVLAYANIFADQVRVRAYEQAIRATVRPGAVVVDLGAGPGIFALMACRAGAARVYAIETDPIIGVARELARANGYADRIVFIEAASRTVDAREAADVLVADVRGVLPLFADGLVTMIDARDRFLRPGGAIVPGRDVLWASLVEAPRTWRLGFETWDGEPYGIDLKAVRAVATHELWRMAPGDGRLLTPPQRWAVLDYRSLATPGVGATLDFSVAERGTAHGIMLWFETELSAGVSFSTGPDGPPLVYGRALLPWPEATACEPGTRVHVDLRADYVVDRYVWTWTSAITPPAGAPARFRQSTLQSSLLSRAQLPGPASRR